MPCKLAGYCPAGSLDITTIGSSGSGQISSRTFHAVRRKSTVTVEFAYDGGGVGKGGVATIGINGKEAGRARIENTVAGRFGMSAGYGDQSARLECCHSRIG